MAQKRSEPGIHCCLTSWPDGYLLTKSSSRVPAVQVDNDFEEQISAMATQARV